MTPPPPEPIKETVSENAPKPKRGRPKSFQRIWAESSDKMGYMPDGIQSTRGKINHMFFVSFIGGLKTATPDIQFRVIGCHWQDVRNGTHNLPNGFPTTATEIGRWLANQPDEAEAAQAALLTVANARDENIPWRDIRAHFRTMRLGEREGNAVALTKHLAHAFDDYLRMFPGTAHSAQVAGIRDLLEIVELSANE